jgi:hypothetical protein
VVVVVVVVGITSHTPAFEALRATEDDYAYVYDDGNLQPPSHGERWHGRRRVVPSRREG